MKARLVLGVETSCDETGVAVCDEHGRLLAHELYSQIELHRLYGGVVPELASRDHVRKLLPLIRRTLEAAELAPADLDAVAYTAGPGLSGALLVGASVAAGLAYAWDVPCIPVHHMEGHLLASLLESPAPSMPFLALLVSGGHTMLAAVEDIGRYTTLGQTLDDAAGEAFDKTAKLLGLPYPGGPHLAKLAQSGNPKAYALPRPMLDRPGLDFSFSGLKTAVRLAVMAARGDRRQLDAQLDAQTAADLAASFQAAVVDTLVGRTLQALDATGLPAVVVAGGVGANRQLRETLAAEAGKRGVQVYYPRPAFCTDNGAMIALAGALRLARGMHLPADGSADGQVASRSGELPTIQARARWNLDELGAGA